MVLHLAEHLDIPLRERNRLLLTPPITVLRLSLHPEGVAPAVLNYVQWRTYLLQRLVRETELTGDPYLAELLAELRSYPVPRRSPDRPSSIAHADSRVFVPLELETPAGTLSFISTTTVFGTSVDITVSELTLEMRFPAGASTAEHLRGSLPVAT